VTHRDLGDLGGTGFVFVPSPLESDRSIQPLEVGRAGDRRRGCRHFQRVTQLVRERRDAFFFASGADDPRDQIRRRRRAIYKPQRAARVHHALDADVNDDVRSIQLVTKLGEAGRSQESNAEELARGRVERTDVGQRRGRRIRRGGWSRSSRNDRQHGRNREDERRNGHAIDLTTVAPRTPPKRVR